MYSWPQKLFRHTTRVLSVYVFGGLAYICVPTLDSMWSDTDRERASTSLIRETRREIHFLHIIHYFLRGLNVLGVPMILNSKVIYFTVPMTTGRCGFINKHTRSIIAARQKLMVLGNSFCATLRGFVLAPAIPLPAVTLGPKCTGRGLAGSLPPGKCIQIYS